MIRAWSITVLASTIALGAGGCKKAGAPAMTVYPVSGKLTVAGQPVKNLKVTLSPKEALADMRRVPGAIVEADGSFQIHTYDVADGAPAGAYAVLVRAPTQSTTEAVRQIVNQYSTQQSPAAEVVVKAGVNVLDPIDLKAK
jgi:hypothetical protein